MKKINNTKLEITLKIGTSIFIIYHLLVIFILPNQVSIVYDTFKPYLISYAHSLSIDVAWNYFAPNPINYFYFEYETIQGRTVRTYRWPPTRRESKKNFFNHNRLIYHALFFFRLNKHNVRRHFLPYLCRLHPTVKEVSAKIMVRDKVHFKKIRVLPRFSKLRRGQDLTELFSVATRCRRRGSRSRNIDSYDEDMDSYYDEDE